MLNRNKCILLVLVVHGLPQAFDAAGLGEWLFHTRRAFRHGALPDWQQRRLESMGLQRSVDGLTAKWHDNFHEARRYKV
jgi:hypothetical protein